MGKMKVIRCMADRLEDALNALERPYSIIMQHWRETPDGLEVILVLTPIQPALNVDPRQLRNLRS